MDRLASWEAFAGLLNVMNSIEDVTTRLSCLGINDAAGHLAEVKTLVLRRMEQIQVSADAEIEVN